MGTVESHPSGSEDLKPVGGGVGEVIGCGIGERVGLEAEGAANAPNSAVAGGQYVDVSVTDHDGFGRGNEAAVEGGGFGNESLEAVGIGFFGVEAVAAIVLEEKNAKDQNSRRCHGTGGQVYS